MEGFFFVMILNWRAVTMLDGDIIDNLVIEPLKIACKEITAKMSQIKILVI
tara:strand:+ start:493 stop:645 length:153 start_codon:yes stop_codon:yes gene_type:complete